MVYADAKIPITGSEFIDMSLRIHKDRTEEYTMQYRDMSKDLHIKCDTAHGKPHIDVDWHNVRHLTGNEKNKIQRKRHCIVHVGWFNNEMRCYPTRMIQNRKNPS